MTGPDTWEKDLDEWKRVVSGDVLTRSACQRPCNCWRADKWRLRRGGWVTRVLMIPVLKNEGLNFRASIPVLKK